MQNRTSNEAKQGPNPVSIAPHGRTTGRNGQPLPAFWISFGIVGTALIVVALFFFSADSEHLHFITTAVIGLAVAALPWISAFRVKGLIEIEREIDRTRDEAKERIEQSTSRFEDKLASLRMELTLRLNNLQTQQSQQVAAQALHSNTYVQFPDIPPQEAKKVEDVVEGAKESNIGDSLPPGELTKKYEDLKSGFARAVSRLLNDPLGLRVGAFLRQVPDTGQSFEQFREKYLKGPTTGQEFETQFELMKSLRASNKTF
jgi:hypothetical protein